MRNFNSIAYDDLRGQITKSSKNKEKIFNEINWFKNIPVDLQIFTPRLIDNKTTRDVASYSLEFYGYQSLADFFVFGSLYPQIWHNIINKLLDIINLFRTHKAYLPYSYYHDIYYKKTLERLEKMETDRSWKKLKEQNEIFINGRKYNNINHFIKLLEKAVKKLYIKKEMTFIHGDLCLSNILFDPINRIFKFIDPRGHFGVASIYGDIKYDIAKLRHSFSGFYDFIISDTFEFKEESDSSFIFHNHTEKIHHEIADYFDAQLIKRGYDLEQIKLIEALLFLSMTPLHDDHPARQKAMYLTGIILINQTKI